MDRKSPEASAWRLTEAVAGEAEEASVRVRVGDLRWLLAKAGIEAADDRR